MPTTPMHGDLISREVCALVHKHGGLTRTQLADLMDLPRSTVADHVRMLLRQGRLVEGATPEAQRGRGRPAARLYTSDRSTVLFAAVVMRHGQDLLNGPAVCALIEANGTIAWRATAEPSTQPLKRCAELVAKGCAAVGISATSLSQVVVVVPLPVVAEVSDSSHAARPSHIVTSLAQLIGEKPHQRFAEMLGAPALLINDADAAALGEAHYADRADRDLAYLKTMTGLGMGITIGGALLLRPGHTTGEIAHIRLPGNNAVCMCGSKGCWFTRVSEGLGLAAMAKHAGATVHHLSELQEACRRDDRSAVAAVHKVGFLIGQLTAPIYSVTPPVVTVLERELGPLFLPLATGFTQAIEASAPEWTAHRPGTVRLSKLAEPELMGAWVHARQAAAAAESLA